MDDRQFSEPEDLAQHQGALIGGGSIAVHEQDLCRPAGFKVHADAQAGDGIKGVMQLPVVQSTRWCGQSGRVAQGVVADENASVVFISGQARVGLVRDVGRMKIDLRRGPGVARIGGRGLEHAVSAEDGLQLGHKPRGDMLAVVERMPQRRIGIVETNLPV